MKKYILALAMGMLIITGCGKSAAEEKSYIELGMENIQAGNIEDAMGNFDAAEAVKEDSQLVNRGRGIAAMTAGDYQSAIEYFKTVLSTADDGITNVELDTVYYLASAQYKNGDIEGAINTYTNIIAYSKKEKDAYYLRGCAYVETDLIDLAMKDFEKTIDLDEGNFELYIQIFQCLNAKAYTEQAQSILNRALESKVCKSEINKGIVYYYLQDQTSALTALTKAREEKVSEALLYIGKVYESLNDANSAVSLYNEYLETVENPKDEALIYNTLGLCEFNNGNYSEAVKYFEQGLAIDDKNANQQLLFNEIVAYEYANDFETAASKMDEYIALYPDDEVAQREYKFLSTR